jgi:uncharacterized NAD-dependent epimerase/dehydratase family protein
LGGGPTGIPVVEGLGAALCDAERRGLKATHFVVGIAPDGGRLSVEARGSVLEAIRCGLNVDSGLHDLLTEDEEIRALAERYGVKIRDVRKTPPRSELHSFTGKIKEVTSFKIAVLGTDSAVGKRTTAWIIVDALRQVGFSAELIGTGQTAWMQGARYGVIIDSLINDFVAGEIENAVWRCWKELSPDAIVIEGQGSLMNPAYPGGFEILAAAKPDLVVLQHAPRRVDYDGFPGFKIHPLKTQVEAIRLISGRDVVAVTVNHEGMSAEEIPLECGFIERDVGIPAMDLLYAGAERLVELLTPLIKRSLDAGRNRN